MTSMSAAIQGSTRSYGATCRDALSFLISPPDAARHFERAQEGSCASAAFHLCVGTVESIPVLGAGVSLVERAVTVVADTCLYDRRQRQMRRKFITNFWEENLRDFKISHGTSALYQGHFKKYGISATYPEALRSFIPKIRKVWAAHEKDIFPKTGYFRDIEKRHDEAARANKVAVSFSANPRVTEEFTRGARGYGGELVRELSQFLREAREKEGLLSAEEKEVVEELDALIDVMKIVPPMIIKARLTDSAKLISRFPCFLFKHPETFVSFVERESRSLLLGDIIKSLQGVRQQLERLQIDYEIVVERSIPPSELEFEVLPSRYPNFPKEKLNERHQRWLQAFNVSL